MRQITNYGDQRMQGYCVHCGGPNESKDHVPSKVFLDEPFPENLPVSPSCIECNNGFSSDEEYLACALECVICGEVCADLIERPKIADILRRKPALAALLDQAKRIDNGTVVWDIDQQRAANVLLKLARGHVAYENNEPQTGAPNELWMKPLILMETGERQSFEHPTQSPFAPWPEVGSRAMFRAVEGEDYDEDGWIVVQKDRYRFRVLLLDGLRVQIVVLEYLACEIYWD